MKNSALKKQTFLRLHTEGWLSVHWLEFIGQSWPTRARTAFLIHPYTQSTTQIRFNIFYQSDILHWNVKVELNFVFDSVKLETPEVRFTKEVDFVLSLSLFGTFKIKKNSARRWKCNSGKSMNVRQLFKVITFWFFASCLDDVSCLWTMALFFWCV